jgi:hypothetical protein
MATPPGNPCQGHRPPRPTPPATFACGPSASDTEEQSPGDRARARLAAPLDEMDASARARSAPTSLLVCGSRNEAPLLRDSAKRRRQRQLAHPKKPSRARRVARRRRPRASLSWQVVRCKTTSASLFRCKSAQLEAQCRSVRAVLARGHVADGVRLATCLFDGGPPAVSRHACGARRLSRWWAEASRRA